MSDDLRRRSVLTSMGTSLALGVAGCSGDGDDGTNDDGSGTTEEPVETQAETATDAATATADDGTATASEATTPATSKESAGTLVNDRIPEVEFVGWRTEAGDFGTFTVYMHVENAGSEPFHAGDYTWGLVPYAEDGQELTVSAAGPVNVEYDGPLEPGASGEVSYHVRVDDAHEVSAYDIHLTCEGTGADGVYCPD